MHSYAPFNFSHWLITIGPVLLYVSDQQIGSILRDHTSPKERLRDVVHSINGRQPGRNSRAAALKDQRSRLREGMTIPTRQPRSPGQSQRDERNGAGQLEQVAS